LKLKLKDPKTSAISARVKRIVDLRDITVAAQYGSDTRLPGMKYA